ncbi:integrase [Aeromonas phage 59.1]|nr:integrase [Aeromonas phage 59.1]
MISSTIRTSISDASIKRHMGDKEVTQLSDPSSSMVFRYSTKDRERGSFHLRHYQGGRERWALVAKFPDVSTKAARKIYHHMKEKLFLTPDATALVDRLGTMSDLLQWYQSRVERNSEITKARARTVIGMIDNHLMKLGAIAVLSLSKSEVDRVLIQPMIEQYAPSYVRGVLVVLKQATKAATAMNLITIDPLAGWTYKDFGTARVKPKAPKLNQSDLAEVIACIPPAGRIRTLMLLMLSWGTRIGETAALRWRWIDIEGKACRIPAQYTKTGEQLDIPLTKQVIQVLGIHKMSQRSNSAFVFPGQSGKSLDVSLLHKEVKKATNGAWSSHELRKLVRTLLATQGVDYYVGERILNHSQSTLDKVYNAALLWSQKANALTTYSDMLEREGAYK